MYEDCKTLDEWLDILFTERDGYGFGCKADVYEVLGIDGNGMMSEAEFQNLLADLLGEEQTRCILNTNNW